MDRGLNGVYLYTVSYVAPLLVGIATYQTHSVVPVLIYGACIGLFRAALKHAWTHAWQIRNIYEPLLQYFYCPPQTSRPNDTKTLVVVFPHGVCAIGTAIQGAMTIDGSNTVTFIADALLKTPLIGDFMYKLGCRSASKQSVKANMCRGRNCTLLPGGFYELLMTTPFEYNLFVPTGFIALALEHGYTIQPVLGLGENEAFITIGPPKWTWPLVYRCLRKISIPILLVVGHQRVPVIPYRGVPVQCTTGDTVDNVRDRVIASLRATFHDHIEEYCNHRNALGIRPVVSPAMYSIHWYDSTGRSNDSYT